MESKATPITLEELVKAFLSDSITLRGSISEIPKPLNQHSLRLLDFASNDLIQSIFNIISDDPMDRWIFFGSCLSLNFVLLDPVLMLNVVMKENIKINAVGTVFKVKDFIGAFRRNAEKLLTIRSLIRTFLFSCLDSDQFMRNNPLMPNIRTALIHYHRSFQRESVTAIKDYITAQENLIQLCIEVIMNEVNFNTQDVTAFEPAACHLVLDQMLSIIRMSQNSLISEAKCLTATRDELNVRRANDLKNTNQRLLVGLDKVIEVIGQWQGGKKNEHKRELALIKAINEGALESFYLILKEKPDLNFCHQVEAVNPALHLAAAKGSTEMVSALIDNGADVNGNNTEGLTPLFLAIVGGYFQVGRVLLERGARVNFEGWDGETPLLTAIKCCSERGSKAEFVQLLIEFGANIHAISKQGYSPLYIASCYGKAAVVRFLLSKRANIDLQSVAPKKPMMRPNLGEHGMAFIPYYICDQMILPLGHVPTPSVGATPLFGAVNNGHVETATLLLEFGANPNLGTLRGQSPLLCAFLKKDLAMVTLLLNKGADPNPPCAESSVPF